MGGGPGSQAQTVPRGQGRDPLGQGPGLGPLGPGALGAPGPKMWDTRGDSNYLLSGKLPTVRQATYCQAKLPTVRQATYSQACTQPIHRHAPKRHRHAPKRHRHAPKSLHRLAPNNRVHAHTRAIDMHPKGIDFAPKSSRIHAPKLFDFLEKLKVCRMAQDLSKSVPMVFRSPGKPLIKLFHFIFNSKCHFSKVSFLYNCLLYCLLNCLLYCLLACCRPSGFPTLCFPTNRQFDRQYNRQFTRQLYKNMTFEKLHFELNIK